MPKAAPKLAGAPRSILADTLPTETAALAVTVPDHGVHQKKEKLRQLLLTEGFNPQNFEVGK